MDQAQLAIPAHSPVIPELGTAWDSRTLYIHYSYLALGSDGWQALPYPHFTMEEIRAPQDHVAIKEHGGPTKASCSDDWTPRSHEWQIGGEELELEAGRSPH